MSLEQDEAAMGETEMKSESGAVSAEVYTFARPVKYEGIEYKSITLDFDGLTGEDILSCDRQYKAENRNGTTAVPELEKAYQAHVVAKAAGVHVGLIRALPAKDFTALTMRARGFLLL